MRRSSVLLGIVLLAGCGGGGGERLGRDAYVAKADAICAETAKQQQGLPAPTSVAEIPAYVDEVLPIVDGAVERLRALRPPADLERGVDAWLKAIIEGRDELEQLRSAAESGEAQKVRTVGAEGTKLDERRDLLARSIGLTACANI